jgi:hypothetical protein
MKAQTATAAFLLVIAAESAAFAAQPVRLIVIVPSSQSVSNLSSGDLRRIYIGEMTRWPDGRRIVPVMMPARSRESEAFLKRVVRMSAIDFAQEWISVVFRGRAPAPPMIAATASAALDIVASHPDAIAVIPDVEIPSGMRIVSIDGHLPREQKYPLSW